MTIAYVYKWTHTPTMKWYIGSRTAKNCHPMDGYVCSSKIVKPMILENVDDWKRVIAIGSVEEMLMLETTILETLDAKNDPQSYNQHNGDARFKNKGGVSLTETHKMNLSASLKGRVAWNKGKLMTVEYCQKLKAGHTGKKRPKQKPSSNELRSNALKGRIPWNKGLKLGTQVSIN